jgi:16S rRNA (guanine1207-N2)-methyltransferase
MKTNMYYEDNTDLAHDLHDLRVNLLGNNLIFTTDAGVFSKSAIDFGSQLLLNQLNFKAGETVLDVGAGYGPMGISITKAFDTPVTMVDVNDRALGLAATNAAKNGVTAQIFNSDGYENVDGHFDHIVSNPPIRAGKQVVHRILSEAIDYLNPGGDLTIVIQKKQGGPSAEKRMQEVFGNVETLKRDKGYYIYRSVKEN